MKSTIHFKKVQAGFTLIELMIVVAIIGILAAVAIPAYQNYTIKAKIASAISSVSSIKTAVVICIHEQAGLKDGCSTNAMNIPAFTATKEVTSVVTTNGDIVITLADTGIGADVNGKTITMRSDLNQSTIAWFNTTNITENASAIDLITKHNGS